MIVSLSVFSHTIFQTNGLTERFNQTLSRCLAKLCNEEHTDWDDKINTVLMGYRASSQASTKHSPYFMLFQQEMRLPIDVEVMPTSADSNGQPEVDLESTIQALLERREQVFEKAEKNIKDAQRKQKETYDRKHTPEELSVGTEVMVENTAQKDRKGGKLDDMFKGNYFIHERLGKGLYRLRNQKGVVLQKKFNIARLKVYKRRDTGNGKPLEEDGEKQPEKGEEEVECAFNRKRKNTVEQRKGKAKVSSSILCTFFFANLKNCLHMFMQLSMLTFYI